MAVPTTGQLSLRALANEKLVDDYNDLVNAPINVSLRNMHISNGYPATNMDSPSFPEPEPPHNMDNWRGYDHDFVASLPLSPPSYCACTLTDSANTLEVVWGSSTGGETPYSYEIWVSSVSSTSSFVKKATTSLRVYTLYNMYGSRYWAKIRTLDGNNDYSSYSEVGDSNDGESGEG